MKNIFAKIKSHWLFILIAAQPVLDALAYWTNNTRSSWAGYVRLAIMLALPLYMLFKIEKKRPFIISMAAIAGFCLLHILNCFRVGYIDPIRDINYMARIAQMPILAICFVYALRTEEMKTQALKAMELAAGLTLFILLLSIVTGTDNCTYGVGLGVSGWVIDNNRCANSIILVTLSTFALYFAAKSDKKWINVLIPLVVGGVFISNGTKACYLGLFVLFLGFMGFLLLNGLINKQKVNKTLVVTLLLASVAAALVYPVTPRAKVEALENSAVALKDEDELVRILSEMGYDLSSMTTDEKLNDPIVRKCFEDYYRKLMWHVIPEMFDRYDMERIMRKYDMTTSAAKLIDVRTMKRTYASLIWEDCDTITKFVGFEVSQIHDPGLDPENDWPALYWYCGYMGFGLYVAFVLYFLIKILLLCIKDFKSAFNLTNFTLLISLGLELCLAEFSGALLRRPNVSIYLSVLLALVYYRTAVEPNRLGDANEA